MRENLQKALCIGAWFLGGLLIGASLLVRLYNPDLWWHLAAGRAMAQTHSFLWTDIFSHTLYGAPWINFEWLSQLLIYGLYVAGGFWLLYAFKIVVCAAVVFLLYQEARAMGATGPVLFLLTWTGFKVVQPRLQDRPELATLFFLGLLVCMLLRVRTARDAGSKWFPVVVFATMVLWTNLHGGFVYGLAVLGLFYLGAVWERDASYSKLLFRAGLAALAGVLVNPYGVKLFIVFWEHYHQLKSGGSAIMEWKTPEVSELPYFWSLYILCGAAMAVALLQRRPGARFWTPVVLFFTAWGSLFYRNVALLAFVAVPFLAHVFPLKKVRWVWWLPLFALLCLDIKWLKRPFPESPVIWNRVPAGACEFVRAQNIHGVMFNTYDVGGYIEWALGPERRVFMDGRYIFYPLLDRFDKLSSAVQSQGVEGSGWATYFEEQRTDYAIVNYTDLYFNYPQGMHPFHFSLLNVLFPRDSWALVFWDDAGLVFLKRAPVFKKIIEQEEYKSVWPYNLEQMAFLLKNGNVMPGAVQAELSRNKKISGPTIYGQEIENLLKMTTSHLK